MKLLKKRTVAGLWWGGFGIVGVEDSVGDDHVRSSCGLGNELSVSILPFQVALLSGKSQPPLQLDEVI